MVAWRNEISNLVFNNILLGALIREILVLTLTGQFKQLSLMRGSSLRFDVLRVTKMRKREWKIENCEIKNGSSWVAFKPSQRSFVVVKTTQQ